MTNDRGKPRLVGSVLADGEGGDVFEENGVFYSIGTSMVITPDDREVVAQTRSADFASLDAFMQSLPRGVRFVSRS